MQKGVKISLRKVRVLKLILSALCIVTLVACQTTPNNCPPHIPPINPIDLNNAAIRLDDGTVINANGQYWSNEQLAHLMLYIDDLVECVN